MSPAAASATPRSVPSVVSSHQVRVDSFEAWGHDPGDDQRQGQVPLRPAGPSSPGRPSLRAIACTAATCPCGTDRVIVTASDGGHQRRALQPGVDQVDEWSGSTDRFATVSFLTWPASR